MCAYKAALIACGERGIANAKAYQYIDNATLVACCDTNKERREGLANNLGIRAYADAREMILAEKPDIVHIATLPNLRVEPLTLVSDLNVPLCTVEKPIALGVADWRLLGELEARSDTRFAVSHQFRWHPQFARCQEAVRGGKIGRVLFLDVSARLDIADQGTHTLNYGRSLIGDPAVKSVFGNVHGWDTSNPNHPAPEAAEGYLTFDTGVRALWTTGPVSMMTGDPGIKWQHVRAAAYGESGRVNWEEFGRWEIVTEDGAEVGDFGGMQTWRQNNDLAEAAFFKSMFEWHESGTAPGTNLRESLHEWKVVLALYESGLTHKVITLASYDPRDDLFDRLQATLK